MTMRAPRTLTPWLLTLGTAAILAMMPAAFGQGPGGQVPPGQGQAPGGQRPPGQYTPPRTKIPAQNPPAVTTPTDLTKFTVPAPTDANTLYFESKLGSFKCLGSDETPVTGKLTFSFTGTVLISGLVKGSTVETTGAVRKEYTTKDGLKVAYHGVGGMTITGRVRAVQFFGQNLVGQFSGVGLFRMFGEFDKNLETGFYWYKGGDRIPWGTGGATMPVPNQQATVENPQVKIHKG